MRLVNSDRDEVTVDDGTKPVDGAMVLLQG